jgi:restriction system protein
MADVSYQRVSELLRGVFELLWRKPEGLPAREVLAFLREIVELSDFEKGVIAPSHMPRYEKIVRIAIIPLVKAGWLDKSSAGIWSITREGREVGQKYPTVQELYQDAVRLLEEREQKQQISFLAMEEAEELAWDQIHRFLVEMKREDIRHLVSGLLQAMGYHLAWVAPVDKDHGQIDMIATVDPLGVNGSQIVVQIKHKKQTITLEGLRSFLPVLGTDRHGLLISIGGLSKGLREEAIGDQYKRITLWDLDDLFELWVKYYNKLDQDTRACLPLKAVYFLNSFS